MAEVRRRVLGLAALTGALALGAWYGPAYARRFYPDDPLWRVPDPLPVGKARKRSINEYYDFFQHTFFEPGRERRHLPIPPAGDVNTLGEVPDSGWYHNEHRGMPRTVQDLVQGPGNNNSPARNAPWKVVSGKKEGVTPGLVIEDSRGRRYLLKFDPLTNPEMASAADIIGSKFFYALGYFVPENYIVRFSRNQLQVTTKSAIVDDQGNQRRMTDRDVSDILKMTPVDREGNYRAMASLFLPGEIIGPFTYYGVRGDDPNDIVPHENRRELRGLYVFAAWLNHTDCKALNTLDSVIEENGLRYIRHHLIDFGAIMGSDSFIAKSPRAGNVYLFDFKPAAIQFLTLGLYIPEWQRAHFPDIPSVGNFESATFDPRTWKSNYPNPAFDNRLPDDIYWATKKLMSLRDEHIRAVVETGQYSDPRAVEWITRTLIERRDKIGRAFLNCVLPLENFQIQDNALRFEDLAVKYGFAAARKYVIQWFRFNNETEEKTPAGAATFSVPSEFLAGANGSYYGAEIRGDDGVKKVALYFRKQASGLELVGIDRTW